MLLGQLIFASFVSSHPATPPPSKPIMNLSLSSGQHHHPLTYLCCILSIVVIILNTTHTYLWAPYPYLYASTHRSIQTDPHNAAITSQIHDSNLPYMATTDPHASVVHEEDIHTATSHDTTDEDELNKQERATDQSFYNHPIATILDHKNPTANPRSQALGVQTGSVRHDTLVGLFFSHNPPSSWWLSAQSRLTHSLGYTWLSTQVQRAHYSMNIAEKILSIQTQYSYYPLKKLNWFLSAAIACHYQWIDLNEVEFYTITNHQNSYQFRVLGSSLQTGLGYQHTFPRPKANHSSKHTQKYFVQIQFITLGYYKLLLNPEQNKVNNQIFETYQELFSNISFKLPSANIIFGYHLALGYYL